MLTRVEYDDTIGFVLTDSSQHSLAKLKRHKNRTVKMSTETQNSEQSEKDTLLNEAQKRVDAINADRGTKKGTRLKVGQTRGKGSQVITFEVFDENTPDLNPTSIDEFMQMAGLEKNEQGEKALVSMLIDGYNQQSYTNASDPIAEYIDSTWTPDEQKAFKLVVKNMAAAMGISVEDSVAMIKPNFVSGLAKKRAAK